MGSVQPSRLVLSCLRRVFGHRQLKQVWDARDNRQPHGEDGAVRDSRGGGGGDSSSPPREVLKAVGAFLELVGVGWKMKKKNQKNKMDDYTFLQSVFLNYLT